MKLCVVLSGFCLCSLSREMRRRIPSRLLESAKVDCARCTPRQGTFETHDLMLHYLDVKLIN